MSAFVSAVIVAAGGSVRMGIADSKQFIPLLSRPAIEYTLKAFQKCHLIKEIVIAVSYTHLTLPTNSRV